MAASFHKSNLRGDDELSLNFECPWCGNQQDAKAFTISQPDAHSAWLVAVCVAPPCRRPVLARVPLRGSAPWEVINTTTPGMEFEYGVPHLHPTPMPTYAPHGVPEPI